MENTMSIETLIVAGVVLAAAAVLTRKAVRAIRAQLSDEGPPCNGGCDCGPSAPPQGRKGRLPVVDPIVVAALLLSPGALQAADTIETFDPGPTDLEFYVGLDGVGPKHQDRTVSTEVVAGFGIIDRLSLYVGAALEADHRFSGGAAGLNVGLFGTPIDTRHIDLDVVLDVGAAGPGFEQLCLTPMAELNVDLDPDMGSWGVYLRAGAAIEGSSEEGSSLPPSFAVLLNPGTYLTVAGRHQILLEYDMALLPQTGEVEVGGIALGWNVVLAEPIELVTQLALDIPQADERAAIGASVGFVATLPSPGAAQVE